MGQVSQSLARTFSMAQLDALRKCFLSKSHLKFNRKQLDMSSDVSVTLRSSKTTFKANISALQSGKSDHRKVSPYPSRHRTAQDTRRTDGARRLPRPTEPWEEYDTDPAMNIIVVLLFPGRKEERQRAGGRKAIRCKNPSLNRPYVHVLRWHMGTDMTGYLAPFGRRPQPDLLLCRLGI